MPHSGILRRITEADLISFFADNDIDVTEDLKKYDFSKISAEESVEIFNELCQKYNVSAID